MDISTKDAIDYTVKKICNLIAWVCLCFFVYLLLTGQYYRDSTDQPGGARSGIKLRTDALTGCQYLESIGGGLTPRMDGSGRHMCEGFL